MLLTSDRIVRGHIDDFILREVLRRRGE